MKKLIRLLQQLDLILDSKQARGCPICGNYRIKFDGLWECPQSGRFCGIWDRLGKNRIKEPGFRDYL